MPNHKKTINDAFLAMLRDRKVTKGQALDILYTFSIAVGNMIIYLKMLDIPDDEPLPHNVDMGKFSAN